MCTGYVINRGCELGALPFPGNSDACLCTFDRAIGTGLAGILSQISCDFTSLPARLRFDLARFRRDLKKLKNE